MAHRTQNQTLHTRIHAVIHAVTRRQPLEICTDPAKRTHRTLTNIRAHIKIHQAIWRGGGRRAFRWGWIWWAWLLVLTALGVWLLLACCCCGCDAAAVMLLVPTCLPPSLALLPPLLLLLLLLLQPSVMVHGTFRDERLLERAPSAAC